MDIRIFISQMAINKLVCIAVLFYVNLLNIMKIDYYVQYDK